MMALRVRELVRDYYIMLPGGPPTQGDIWTNLPSPFRDQETGFGLLITPRCDLAHDKAGFVNYMPLVPFQEYLYTEGGFELLEQELSSARDGARTKARELGVDRLLSAGVPVSEAITVAQNTMGPTLWTAPKVQACVTELRKVLERAEALTEKLAADRLDSDVMAAFIGSRALTKYKKQIARNGIADLHFLPPCPPIFSRPAIVLLRCVGTCDETLIRAATSCVTQHDWERALETPPARRWNIRDKPERVARLKSPYLEALMARFGALFTRVGTRDIPDEAISAMIDEES